MTSPLPPRRRDTRSHWDLLRQDQVNLRQLDPGLMGGRFAPAKPVDWSIDDEDGDDGDTETIVGQDTDRLVLADLTTQVWTLVGTPLDGTLVVRWHPDAGAGVEWKRGEHYTIADDANVVVISATALATTRAQVGDVFSAQYLSLAGDEADGATDFPLDSLFLVGASGSVNSPSTIALPDGTQIGDLIVVGSATLNYDGTPGTGHPTDPRLTQLGHGAWVGIATDLSPVQFTTTVFPMRHTACVATFRAPAYYKNDLDTSGPGGTGATMTVPQPDATATVMVYTTEVANGLGNSLVSYPADYLVASNPNDPSTVCKAGILYWPPDGTSTPPGGTVAYNGGTGYMTVIGLQGDDDL